MSPIPADTAKSIAYWILEACAQYNLADLEDIASDFLGYRPHEASTLRMRLKFAELRSLCENTPHVQLELDRLLQLYDELIPCSDPSNTDLKSPWFFFRTLIIVTSALNARNDEQVYERFCKRLLYFPSANKNSVWEVKRQIYLQQLAKEMESFANDAFNESETSQYLKLSKYVGQWHQYAEPLEKFIKFAERRAGLETCFLEAVAEDVHRSETDSSGLVLSDEKQTRGLTLLSEQFQADFICDSNRLVSEQNFGEENVDVSSDHYSDNTQEISQQERLRFSNRHVENRVKKPNRRKPITTDEAGLQEGDDLIEKRPRKVDKKRRSRSKILDIVEPDPLDKAMEVANRIEQALASGDYERWSDGEKEGASEVLEAEPASDNDLSIIPYPKHKRRGAKQKLALPDTHLHSVPSPITLVKAESRRRLGKFTDDEVYELKKGIAKHGVGQWKEILEAGNFQEGRTTMDIKDKYRNMVKKNNIAQNH